MYSSQQWLNQMYTYNLFLESETQFLSKQEIIYKVLHFKYPRPKQFYFPMRFCFISDLTLTQKTPNHNFFVFLEINIKGVAKYMFVDFFLWHAFQNS